MEALDRLSTVKNPYEQLTETLATFGLGSPVTRVVMGFLVGSGLTYLFQPRWAFDAAGARPFSLTDDDPRSTKFPWYGPGILFALLFGVFF